MNRIEQATQFMINIANDNSHGYSQSNRWGSPDYDCSSLVISAWEHAGVPVKTMGATYTGNMYQVFRSCGFEDVTRSVNLQTGSGLMRGDVCLNHANHVVMYIGNGQIVHARSSEGNYQSGDQSGNEIRIQSYWNYPWDAILRYSQDESENVKPESTGSATIQETTPTGSNNTSGRIDTVRAVQIWLNQNYSAGLTLDGLYGTATQTALIKALQKAVNIPVSGKYDSATYEACRKLDLQYRSKGNAVKILQAFLVCHGYKSAYIDGEFGSGTKSSLIDYQKRKGLDPDGIAAQETFKSLCN